MRKVLFSSYFAANIILKMRGKNKIEMQEPHEPQSPLNRTHKHLDGYGKWNKLNQMNFKRNMVYSWIIKLRMKRLFQEHWQQHTVCSVHSIICRDNIIFVAVLYHSEESGVDCVITFFK